MSNDAHEKAAQEERFADVFAHLREQDIEQFYAHYQLWVLRRRLPLLEKQLEALREHLAENQRVTESLRPSALALAVLVRLQSNGVNDTDVLDLMLDRGEDWLDRMMQRLDYCEQVEDFIQGDYNQWCIRSLEGAYDWIDSLLGSIKEEPARRDSSGSSNEATEELLLQKLSQDDEEAMLRVIPTPPATQFANTSANGTIPDAQAVTPTHEDELITAPDEQISASDESGAADNKPDPIALSDATIEPQEENEPEHLAELIGWKDLEDLEAPGESPLPWYSVDVNENGATSIPATTTQSTSMNDWITILQADTSTDTDVDAMAPASSAELLASIDAAAKVESPAPTDETPETSPEPMGTSDTQSDELELVLTSEIQSIAESAAPISPEQEQAAQMVEEVTETEASSGVQSDISVDETDAAELQSAEEVPSPKGMLTPAANHAEETLLNDETTHLAGATDEVATSTEEILEESELSPLGTHVEATEELEQAGEEQETDVSESREINQEEAPLQENELDASTEMGEQVRPSDAIEQAQDEVQKIQIEPGADVEMQSDLADLAQAETEQTAHAEEQATLAVPVQAKAEDAQAQIVLTELAPADDTSAEVAETHRTGAEVAPTLASEPLANAEPPVQVEAIAVERQEPSSEAEPQEANQAQATDKQTSAHEIETAAIVNDILSAEEEQEEQLPWYEYLDLEEPVQNQALLSREEHIEDEKTSEPSLHEANSSVSYEQVSVAKSADEQNLAPGANGAREEAVEIEGWQNWNAAEADEETLPLALKEIQRAQKTPFTHQSEDKEDSVLNQAEAVTEVSHGDSEENASINTQDVPTSIEASAGQDDKNGVEAEQQSSREKRIEEQPTLLLNKIETPRESLQPEVARVEIDKADQTRSELVSASFGPPEIAQGLAAPTGQNANASGQQQASTYKSSPQMLQGQATSTQTPKPDTEPSRKRGFWWRLFHFGRKKKG